jgi:hypothetical protein
VSPRLPDKLPLKRTSLGDARHEGFAADAAPGAGGPGKVILRLRNRRVLGAVAAVVVIVLVVLIASSGGQAVTPPATGAASVVPSDVLAYIHLSTDDSRAPVKSALALLGRFPGYPQLLLRDDLAAWLGATRSGRAVNFDRDIRPWLGKEAALAILDTGTSTAGSLVVIGVGNRPAAARFIAGLPSDGSASYRGTKITGHPRADDSAFVGHYLVLGHAAAIRAAIDVAAGRAPSLSEYPVYQRAAASEPAGRVVDAYFSAAGVTRLVASQGGLVGEAGALIYQATLQGVGLALTPASGGVQVAIRSVFDPQIARTRAASFTPSLPSSIPAGADLFLDLTGLNKTLPRVLKTTGIGGRIPELLKRLGIALEAQGISVKQDIASLFERESAVVVSTPGGSPVLTVIARTPAPDQTRTVFAQLELPFARLFAPVGNAAGRAPVFNQVTVAGVTAHQLVVAPGLQFDYAVFDNELVLSTSLAGIAGVARHGSSILDEAAYRATLGNHPASITSLLFLDLNQLLRVGEQTGLMTGAQFRALKPDLDRVRAIGFVSTSGEAESTAELSLQIP